MQLHEYACRALEGTGHGQILHWKCIHCSHERKTHEFGKLGLPKHDYIGKLSHPNEFRCPKGRVSLEWEDARCDQGYDCHEIERIHGHKGTKILCPICKTDNRQMFDYSIFLTDEHSIICPTCKCPLDVLSEVTVTYSVIPKEGTF